MMVMSLALPLERFEGFRLAHCRGKAYMTKTLAANDGGAHRQQSTKSGRGINGKDDNDVKDNIIEDDGNDGKDNRRGR